MVDIMSPFGEKFRCYTCIIMAFPEKEGNYRKIIIK